MFAFSRSDDVRYKCSRERNKINVVYVISRLAGVGGCDL